MTRKELKVKYKNSVLGFVWSLLNPLLYLVVFYVVFQVILGPAIPSFPIFLLSGLLLWNLFSTGLGAARPRRSSATPGLVKKVSFPREILPLAAVGSRARALLPAEHRARSPCSLVVRWDVAWAYLPLLPLALARARCCSPARSASCSRRINVYLRDTQHLLELALLAWFWMTPIVYAFMTIGRRGGWFTRLYCSTRSRRS